MGSGRQLGLCALGTKLRPDCRDHQGTSVEGGQWDVYGLLAYRGGADMPHAWPFRKACSHKRSRWAQVWLKSAWGGRLTVLTTILWLCKVLIPAECVCVCVWGGLEVICIISVIALKTIQLINYMYVSV